MARQHSSTRYGSNRCPQPRYFRQAGLKGAQFRDERLAIQRIHEGIRKISTLRRSETSVKRQTQTLAGEWSKTMVANTLLPGGFDQDIPPTVYILGVGRLGKFMAHALTDIEAPPPVTLLSRCHVVCRRWHEEGRIMELIEGNTSHLRSGINLKHVDQPFGPIDKLLVTTKTSDTIPALLAIRDLLRPSSTVCFLQKGMGVIDEVNARIFPNSATRPQYMIGLLNHTINSRPGRAFTIVHHRQGDMYLSVVPRNIATSHQEIFAQRSLVRRMDYGWNRSSRSLLMSLTNTDILNVRGFQYKEMLQVQLERLAVSAALEPLSVVFNCANGKLLDISAVSNLVRELLEEISMVINKLPELQGIGGIKDRFRADRLHSYLFNFVAKAKHSTTSMLQDVRRARCTDIDFVNGYFLKRALEVGVSCPVNRMVVEMVKAKQMMMAVKEDALIPFGGRYD